MYKYKYLTYMYLIKYKFNSDVKLNVENIYSLLTFLHYLYMYRNVSKTRITYLIL